MSALQFDPVEAMGRDGAEIKRLRARVAELEVEVRQTEMLVLEYGQHTVACAIIYEPKCTCGLNDILKRLEKR